jgi:hypothetical protein
MYRRIIEGWGRHNMFAEWEEKVRVSRERNGSVDIITIIGLWKAGPRTGL